MTAILVISLLFIVSVLIWALFTGRNGKAIEDPALKDSTFRRRSADRQIEKQFPDDPFGRGGGESDAVDAGETEKDGGTFKLPYLADDIIPEFSRFRIYRRTLINSEVYAHKRSYDTAISLYEGVRSRINDTGVREKIEADIDYLKLYKKRREEEKKRREEEVKREMGRDSTASGGKPNEVKVTIDGSVPDNIAIGPMPTSISIGIIDPKLTFDPDAIADKVSDRLRLRDEPAGGDRGLTQEEIEQVRNEIEKTRKSMESGGIDVLKEELGDLRREIEGLQARRVQESDEKPAVTQARFDSSEKLVTDTIRELLDRIPGKNAPEPKELKGPERSLEKTIEKERRADEEDDTDFELLSEYGKDKFKDELTDEEIFEKILKEKDEGGDSSFEVIGEKREEHDEVSLTDTEMDVRRKEDESFYKKLLATDRRKTKELPILKVSYDFTRLPDDFSLSREKNILEYSFYKYRPMLVKANDFIGKRKVRDAINYYKVVMQQNIPPEFKSMIRKNITDLTDYLEKYLTGD